MDDELTLEQLDSVLAGQTSLEDELKGRLFILQKEYDKPGITEIEKEVIFEEIERVKNNLMELSVQEQHSRRR